LNATHQLLAYADDMNVLDDNIENIKKIAETSIDASKEVVLEVNTGKTKCMLVSSYKNAGKNNDIKTSNRLFENLLQFKYLGMTVVNQNLIQAEIKRRLNSGNSVQSFLSSHLLSESIQITIYKTIILFLFCMDVKPGLHIKGCTYNDGVWE
jgi:hypothetical protein